MCPRPRVLCGRARAEIKENPVDQYPEQARVPNQRRQYTRRVSNQTPRVRSSKRNHGSGTTPPRLTLWSRPKSTERTERVRVETDWNHVAESPPSFVIFEHIIPPSPKRHFRCHCEWVQTKRRGLLTGVIDLQSPVVRSHTRRPIVCAIRVAMVGKKERGVRSP